MRGSPSLVFELPVFVPPSHCLFVLSLTRILNPCLLATSVCVGDCPSSHLTKWSHCLVACEALRALYFTRVLDPRLLESSVYISDCLSHCLVQ
jgi:hypothetical protein